MNITCNHIKSIICVLFISSLFFSGCTYYAYKDIQVLQPGTDTLVMPITSLTILNNSYHVLQDDNEFNYRDTVHQYSLTGFYYSLDDYGNIPYFTDTTTKIRIDDHKRITYYDWEKLGEIANTNSTKLILLLDASDYNYNTGSFFNDMGYVEAFLDVYIANRWIIIDPLRQKIIKEDVQIDTLSYVEYGYFVPQTEEKIPRVEDVLAEVSWEAGRAFASKYIPTWENRSRLYYVLPVKDYDKAILLFKQNRLDDAAKIMQKFTTFKSKKTAALSMYNMAVICELKGEYEIALEWLRKSVNTKYYYTTVEYIRVIKDRIDVSYKLQNR